MNMKFEIDLLDDQVDHLVLSHLIMSYEILVGEIKALSNIIHPSPSQMEDYKYCRKTLKALKRIIKYFTTESQFQDLNLETI